MQKFHKGRSAETPCFPKDLVGQRVLKWFKGWRPGLGEHWLRPTLEQIHETIDRTNARMDSHRFAGFVMRQISHMRHSFGGLVAFFFF